MDNFNLHKYYTNSYIKEAMGGDDMVRDKIKDLEKPLTKKGEERSTLWDQQTLDTKISEYRKKLKNSGERDLFDQFMLGSLRRGNLAEVQKIIDKMPKKHMNPITADLMTKLVKEGSRTSLSRLALNSEAIPDVSLRNHLRALTGVMDKGWKQPTKAEVESTIKKTNNAVIPFPYSDVILLFVKVTR